LSKAEDLGMVLTVTHVVHNLVSTQGERRIDKGRTRESGRKTRRRTTPEKVSRNTGCR